MANHSSMRLSPKKTVSSRKMAAINMVSLGAFYKFLSFYVYLSIFLRGITGITPLRITWKSRDSTSVRI
jgi:hypothetical protein